MNKRTMLVLMLSAMAVPLYAQEDDLPVIQSRPLQVPTELVPPRAAEFVPPDNVMVGMAGARVDKARHARKIAALMTESGGGVVRVETEDITWGRMQRSAKKKIDFDELDTFVREYQAAGFRELIIPLSSCSPWGSVDCGREACANQVPKPEFMELYAKWITAVVERYDRDGVSDMPELRFPVRIYEIGDSFTASEPAPAAEYLPMLERAYAAAHEAYEGVLIAQAGLVATTAFANEQVEGNLDVSFAASKRLLHHSLPEVRAVLDAPHLFDLLNLHALGDPDELDAFLKWVRSEMEAREYDKPIIITRATPSPFLTGGPGTTCTLTPDLMGVIIPPADEADRCRLVEYFSLLLSKNEFAQSWVHRYAASDLIKKVLVAAEHDVMLINVGVMEDNDEAQSKGYQAADGNTAWVGMVGDKDRRPAFFAMEQVVRLTRGYTEVRRLPTADPRICVYRVLRERGMMYIAWAEAEHLLLPGEGVLRMEVDLPVNSANIVVERMITRPGQIHPPRQFIIPRKGSVTVTLTPQPSFIFGTY